MPDHRQRLESFFANTDIKKLHESIIKNNELKKLFMRYTEGLYNYDEDMGVDGATTEEEYKSEYDPDFWKQDMFNALFWIKEKEYMKAYDELIKLDSSPCDGLLGFLGKTHPMFEQYFYNCGNKQCKCEFII